MPAPVLEVRGVVKQYPGVRALGGVDFEVMPGEVHCIVGPNGAGKSTLIKCISRGVAPTYQELDLVGDLTVMDNIFLGHERRRLGFLDRRGMRRATVDLLA